jgi:hypothetical protein
MGVDSRDLLYPKPCFSLFSLFPCPCLNRRG